MDIAIDKVEIHLDVKHTGRMLTALDNAEGTPREIVILNAGVALYAANVADSIGDGITRARSAVASGAAKKVLEHFVATTQKLAS